MELSRAYGWMKGRAACLNLSWGSIRRSRREWDWYTYGCKLNDGVRNIVREGNRYSYECQQKMTHCGKEYSTRNPQVGYTECV